MTSQLVFESKSGNVFLKESEAKDYQKKMRDAADPDKSLNAPQFYANWYAEDNLYPEKINKIVQTNPQLSATLYWKARTLVSGGINYGFVEYDQNGREVLIPADPTKYPKVENFMRVNKIKKYLADQALEFYKYWNVFPALLRTRDRKQIIGIRHYDSPFCRWGRQNKVNHEIDNCYIHANWQNGVSEEDPYLLKLPAVHQRYGVESTMERSGDVFIYKVAGISSGQIYYQLQEPLHALIESKWPEVVSNIPRFKAAMMKRQMAVKYIIYMPDYWMEEVRYPGQWHEFNPEEKQEKIKLEYQEFDKFLTDIDNAGASILTMFKTNPDTNEAWPSWKIEKVEPNLMEAAYNEDSEIGSSYIATALGVPRQLLGVAPGTSKMNNSGGTEIRNLFNTYIQNIKSEMDQMFEVFEFIRDYNGWDPNLKFWSKAYGLTTLDNVTPSERNFNAQTK